MNYIIKLFGNYNTSLKNYLVIKIHLKIIIWKL